MYHKFGSIDIWPSKQTITETMPEATRDRYPNMEWIIDAFQLSCYSLNRTSLIKAEIHSNDLLHVLPPPVSWAFF